MSAISGFSDYSWLFNPSSSSASSLMNSVGSFSLYNTRGYRAYLKSEYSKSSAAANKVTESISTKKKPYNTNAAKMDNATATAYKDFATDTSELAQSAVKLSGSDAFTLKDGQTKYDMEKISSLAQDYVNKYNDVVKNSTSVKNVSSLQKTKYLISETNANKRMLEKVGVTINEDDTLSFNADTFKKADMSNIKSLFSGYNSYASRVSAKASSINRIVNNEISANNRSYAYQYTPGTLLDSYA